MPANLENSAMTTGLARSVFISISKKGNAKKCTNFYTIDLISQGSKVMLKILQANNNNKKIHEQRTSNVQPGFREGRET